MDPESNGHPSDEELNPSEPNQPHLGPVIDPMEEPSTVASAPDQTIPAQKPVNFP